MSMWISLTSFKNLSTGVVALCQFPGLSFYGHLERILYKRSIGSCELEFSSQNPVLHFEVVGICTVCILEWETIVRDLNFSLCSSLR